MNPSLIPLAEWIVAAGAHLFLQSTLLILAGLVIARFCRRRGPALESVILRTTLVAVILCPVFSLVLNRVGIKGRTLELPAVNPPILAATLTAVPAPAPAAVVSTAPGTTIAVAPLEGHGAQGTNAAAPVAVAAPPVAASNPAPLQDRVHGGVSGLGLAYLLAAGAWVLGGCFLLLRLIVSVHSIVRMLRESDLAEVGVFENCSALARELAVPPPEVRTHADIKSPLLIGFVQPAILLPNVEGMEDLVATREVLLHELAHQVRGDCGWHLLSRAATALLWFQPLLWLLARRIEETAEDVCDNYVIEHAGDRRGYAQQLVALAEQLQFSPAESLAGTGVIAFRSALGQRVVRILDASRNLSRRAHFGATASAMAGSLVAAAIVGLIGVKAAEGPGLPVVSRGITTRILVIGSEQEAFGILSPDESKIAYTDWDAKDDGDLVIKRLDTGKIQNATNASATDKDYDFAEDPVWSPDSNLVAYTWYSGENSDEDLRIASLVDGKVRIVVPYNPDLSLYASDWSADGKTLLCQLYRTDKTQALGIVTVDSGEVRQLISLDWNRADHARFSPDGRYIVFDRTVDGNQDIYLFDVAGQQLRRLTESPRSESGPVWSRDGKFVLFSSDQRGTWDLWGIAVAEGKAVAPPHLIRPNFGNHEKRMTRTGALAFNNSYKEDDGYVVEINPTGADQVGIPKTIAQSFLGHNLCPTWSPDGSKIAFIRDNRLLCVQTIATGKEEVIDPGMRRISTIYWSPDAKWIALYPGGPKANGVHAYNFETRELKVMFEVNNKPEAKNFWPMGWSQDGREFRMVGYQSERPAYLAIGLADGARRELRPSESAEAVGYFDLSPDKTRITYVARQPSGEVVLMVADRGFQQKQVLVHLAPPPAAGTKLAVPNGQAARPLWSPNGRTIAYYSPGDRSVHVVAADGSWNKAVNKGQLKHFQNSRKPIEWSKDGSKLAITLVGSNRGEIGLLGNFLTEGLVTK